jgi:hypothetical protein
MPIMSADEIMLTSLALKLRSAVTNVRKNGMVRNMIGPHTPTMIAQIPSVGGGPFCASAALTRLGPVSFRTAFFNVKFPCS